MKRLGLVIGLLFLGTQTWAAFDHEHTHLTKALKAVVKDDQTVDIAQLQRKPGDLILYLKRVSRVRQKQFSEFSPDQQKAFLINAYNGFALQLIKDNYPLKEVNHMPGVKDPWKLRFIRLFGQERSLNDIANLLKDHHDPRAMLAITTLAASSPPLRPEAYVAENLENQLNEQARTFLRDTSRNRLDFEHKTLKVSAVFKRFQSEFERDGMTLQKFVAPFVSDDANIQAELENGLYSIEHLEPDWKLNTLSKQ